MKQGILLAGYQGIRHINAIIDFYKNDDFYFYIHLKKSCRFTHEEIRSLTDRPNVRVFSQKYETKWGSHRILQSILLLAEEAVKDREIEYFHFISCKDFPIKSGAYVSNFLRENYGKEFIEYVTPPSDKFIKRLMNYYPFSLFNVKNPKGWKRLYRVVHLQRRLKIQRKKPDVPQLAVGETWFTLSAPCLSYIVEQTHKNPSFFKRLRHTYCGEEFYFSTLLANSPFHEKITNDNLRYVLWEDKNGSLPAILDESDYDNLVASNKIFARKFEYPASEKLMKKLLNGTVEVEADAPSSPVK